MKDFVKNNLLPLSILIAGFLVSISIFYGFNLDVLQKIFSIIGSLSLGIALATYFYKKGQDRTTAVIEQISFFRKDIIPEYDKIANLIKTKDPKYIFTRIILNEPTIIFIKANYPKEFRQQSDIFRNDLKVLDAQILLFNMLEEFALKVIHLNTAHHKALNSVKATFIQTIEQNAVALIFEREIIVANDAYSATLHLYSLWKEGVDRTPIEERLKKFV